MNAEITIKLKVSDQETLDDIVEVFTVIASYMAGNDEITVEKDPTIGGIK